MKYPLTIFGTLDLFACYPMILPANMNHKQSTSWDNKLECYVRVYKILFSVFSGKKKKGKGKVQVFVYYNVTLLNQPPLSDLRKLSFLSYLSLKCYPSQTSRHKNNGNNFFIIHNALEH